MNNPYVLLKEAMPLTYSIEIQPDFKALTFSGKEEILIDLKKDTKEIKLNSKNLEIKNVNINNLKAKIIYDKKYETAKFIFQDIIKKGKIKLNFEFKGKIREDLRGFYKSVYENKNEKRIMLTTQFEPTDARTCFPCFDQPDLKARFNLKLIIPKKLDAISNMPIKTQLVKNNLKEIIFNETPIMSTYLLAFIISELEYVEGKTKNNVKVRVYTTPGKKHKANFALDTALKALEYFNNYFKIPYPLPKLDLIAISDFESGAMENWGLVTYRETQLLFDEKESSIGVKQHATTTICHELAHQWFGNLVTMKWWDDLWLNEGFASWIEYKSSDYLHPEFDMWTQFITDEKIPALNLDTLNNTHPIEVKVINPGQINEIFDAISYNKGACVIRMLEEYLGDDIFREGLKYYLNKFKYGNAVTEDLWKSLEKVSKKPVRKLMHLWTQQPGYPIINATQKKSKLKVEQERFFYLKEKSSQIWHIPIKTSKGYYLMQNKNALINSKNLLLNRGQIGFYRVKYDHITLNNLLNSDLDIIEKLGMQNDFYTLARGCRVKIEDFLKIICKFKNEANHALWDDVSLSLGRVYLLFYEKYKDELDKLRIKLFYNIFKKLGWDEKKDDKHTDIMLRSNVIGILGFSGYKKVLEEAKKKFDEHLKGKKLNPNIRAAVYDLTAFQGDKKTFDLLKKMYIKEQSQEEKIRLLIALGLFKQKGLLKKALEFSLSKHVRSQDSIYLFSVIGMSEYGDDLAWEFLKKNWKEIYKRYSDGHMMPGFIKSATLKFKTLDKLRDVDKFFKKNKAPSAERAIKQVLEVIKINKNMIDYNKEINFDNIYS